MIIYLPEINWLTNGINIEVAQFRKVIGETWKQFEMLPEEECLRELYSN